MLFVISKETRDVAGLNEPPAKVERYIWTLYKVVKGAIDRPVARCVGDFPDEAAVRSDIATSKIALKAARFAKVSVDT